MHTWSDGSPLRLAQLAADKDDPDKKALACYGLWLKDREQMMLRFVEERPVSDVTCAFLEWVCQVRRTLREAGTGFSVGQCHMAYLTEGAAVASDTQC